MQANDKSGLFRQRAGEELLPGGHKEAEVF
jgi:hypothetical protein